LPKIYEAQTLAQEPDTAQHNTNTDTLTHDFAKEKRDTTTYSGQLVMINIPL